MHHLDHPLHLPQLSRRIILLSIMLVLFMAPAPQVHASSSADDSAGNDPSLSYVSFLPIIAHHGSIYGYVTEDALPVAGVSLGLRLYDEGRWYAIATTTTDPDGFYSFPGAASLESGQHYIVEYQNTTDPDRLYHWTTRDLASYTAFTSENMGTFDVSNIELVSPPSGSIVSLPYTFQWIPRAAELNDNYEFTLFDPLDQDPYFSTYPGLGYVGSYTLTSLSPEFENAYTYVWRIWIRDPDDPSPGGFGLSFYRYEVQFENLPLTRLDHLPVLLPERASAGGQ